MNYIREKIRIIIAGLVLVCVGFGIGFFSKPTKVTTKTEIKEVVKYVEKKQERKNVKTTKKKIIKKDGEVVEEEVTEDKSETDTELSSSSKKESKKEEKKINNSGITLSALILARDLSVDEYEFGVAFSKRVFSNISMGIIATEKKAVGLTIGLEF
jgi:putative Mn2+ efflux pump MntP